MVSIPGVPTTAVIDISGWILSLKAVDQIMAVTTPLWNNTILALKSIGYPKFRLYWRVGRLLVGLQTRLFVEEVMTFMGKPWSNLKTGFDTISSVGEGGLSQRDAAERKRQNDAQARRLKALARNKRLLKYSPGKFS